MIQEQRMEQRVTIVTEVREGRMAGGLQHHLVVYSTTWGATAPPGGQGGEAQGAV